jgi:hypothetical protein
LAWARSTDLADVAEAAADGLHGLALRLDPVVEPFPSEGEHAGLTVADRFGRRFVGADEVAGVGQPAAADFGPVDSRLTGAFDDAPVEAVIAFGGAADGIEERGLALDEVVKQPVRGRFAGGKPRLRGGGRHIR